jgi:hypothetical protein
VGVFDAALDHVHKYVTTAPQENQSTAIAVAGMMSRKVADRPIAKISASTVSNKTIPAVPTTNISDSMTRVEFEKA